MLCNMPDTYVSSGEGTREYLSGPSERRFWALGTRDRLLRGHRRPGIATSSGGARADASVASWLSVTRGPRPAPSPSCRSITSATKGWFIVESSASVEYLAPRPGNDRAASAILHS